MPVNVPTYKCRNFTIRLKYIIMPSVSVGMYVTISSKLKMCALGYKR